MVFQYEGSLYDDVVESVEAFECHGGAARGVEAVHESVDARARMTVGAAVPDRKDSRNCFLGGWCREGVRGGAEHVNTDGGEVTLGG